MPNRHSPGQRGHYALVHRPTRTLIQRPIRITRRKLIRRHIYRHVTKVHRRNLPRGQRRVGRWLLPVGSWAKPTVAAELVPGVSIVRD